MARFQSTSSGHDLSLIHISISFLKKEPFTGSYQGMRYRIEKTETPIAEDSDEKKTVLGVCIWPQPFCYDKTEETEKTRETFEFTPEGLSQCSCV